jgi:flagellin
MGLRITTNIAAINAHRNLRGSQMEMEKSLTRLSSGFRINQASDDAAGLAISENLRAQIRGYRKASQNALDGISLVQVAEGGLNEVGNMLIRMRELSIQSASDTIGDKERGFIDKEVQNLKQEIDRISKVTKFNGIDVLSGQGPELELQIGVGSSAEKDRLAFNVQDYDSSMEKLGIADVATNTKQDAQANFDKLDVAISKVSENRSTMGALQNRLQSTYNNLMVSDENLSAANSRIRDADIALESAELTKRNILTQSGTATLAQANNNSMLALKLVG